MTTITLTQEQINKVLAENTVEPPVTPPVIPPVVPPVVVPPIVVPPPSNNLHNITWRDVWGVPLRLGEWYSNANIYNRKADGTSIAILIPVITKTCILRIWDVEHNGTPYLKYGVISWRRDFELPVIDSHYWGIGGGVEMVITPDMSGRTIFFNHRIAQSAYRHDGWWSTLQARFA